MELGLSIGLDEVSAYRLYKRVPPEQQLCQICCILLGYKQS